MKPVWDDVNARARGLASRLFARRQLEALTRAADLAELTDAFRRLGLPLPEERETAGRAELELAVRRWAAAALRILARWTGPRRTAALAVVYEEEDRKSLRALLRGAMQGEPAVGRLAGLIPTPTLPERALQELSRQPTPVAMATLLSAWGNPYGAAVAAATAVPQPDPFVVDLALDRAFAAHVLAAARRAGDAELLAYVRETVDLANAVAALVLVEAGRDVVPKDLFLAGGERISITVFEEAAATGEIGAAADRLAQAWAPSALAGVFRRSGRHPADLEDELLRTRIRELGRRVRHSPLGPALVLWFALRLRGQVVDLQRIVWGAALSAPGAVVAASLVTAA